MRKRLWRHADKLPLDQFDASVAISREHAGAHPVRAAEDRVPGSSTDDLPEDVFVTFALDRSRLFPAP